jgi:hypothetical protein
MLADSASNSQISVGDLHQVLRKNYTVSIAQEYSPVFRSFVYYLEHKRSSNILNKLFKDRNEVSLISITKREHAQS